jgi:P27 family predicted phage terminase small subunit
MRGRKPKPTATQIAAGDPRKIGKQKLQQRLLAEPAASTGLPNCPKHLKGRAKAAWKFWALELAIMSLDRRPDAMMLEGACMGYAHAVEADLALARDGMIVEESIVDKESGEVVVLKRKAHPAVSISRIAWNQVRAFAGEFGLSPVSRTRLTLELENTGTGSADLATLLAGPRPPRKTVN